MCTVMLYAKYMLYIKIYYTICTSGLIIIKLITYLFLLIICFIWSKLVRFKHKILLTKLKFKKNI